jgi:chaperone BCS1
LFTEGKIVIVTTNHPSKIDPALLRPGRIDKQYKIDFVEAQEIEEMFLYYFPGRKKKAVLFR